MRNKQIALGFVGCIAPHEWQGTTAFSQAGQMYQAELLSGLRAAGLPASSILSIVPIPAYPKSGRMWVASGGQRLVEGLDVKYLWFLNITPLKQITIGISTLWELLKWGWHNRHVPSRVVCCYNLSVPPGLFTLIGARCVGAKTIAFVCDINVPGATVPNGLAWRLDYWLHRKVMPKFNGHAVSCEAIASDFIPGRPFILLEGGIRKEVLDRTRDVNGKRASVSRGFVIASAGRLDDTNGIPVLLKAFALLKGEEYRLRIAGGGPLEQLVREAATADKRIEYLGLIPFDSVLELYSSSDVLVNMRITKTLNTRYFFPSKMMEYLVSGTPVISTCTGHTKKEFGSFIYPLESETPEALANTISFVARQTPENREEIGLRARAYMETHKTWLQQTQKVAQYIRKIVLDPESETVVERLNQLGIEKS